MTQILYYIDKEKSIHSFSSEPAEEIKERILSGQMETPIRCKNPLCVRFRDLLIVTETDTVRELSGIDRRIAELFCQGLSCEEIGMKTGYSYAGVRYHERKLKRHYRVSSRAEMIAAYARDSLVFLPPLSEENENA